MHEMYDATEQIRMEMTAEINIRHADRDALEKEHGQVWDTQQLKRDFTVRGFAAPFVIVARASDGKRGSLLFQHDPRFYWGFTADDGSSEK
jgi:hypothetical protein